MVLRDATGLELVRRMGEDDESAFEELYSRCWKQLFSYATHKLKSDDDAKDVVQDIFTKIWEKRKSIVIHQSIEAYLQRMAKYGILEKLSKNLQRESLIDHYSKYILPDFIAHTDPIQLEELKMAIDNAVSELPAKLKEVHRLSKQENLSIKEIAARLGISEQTVKNQLSTSMKRLRISLKDAISLFLLVYIRLF